jgi:hypothetical protein
VAVWPKPAGPVWRTGLTGLGSQDTGSFEPEDTRRDRKACVEATRSAVAGHPSDAATKTNSESALGGRVTLVHLLSYFLETLVHLLSYFPSI